MEAAGKWLIVAGGVLVLCGLGLLLTGRLGLPLGRLPGDVAYSGKGFTVYAPIATCILISLVLTILLNLVVRWWQR